MTIPFNVYDFFGYLAAGFVVFFAATTAFVGVEPLLSTPPVGLAIFFLIVIYILGQATSHLASIVFEEWLVGRGLGRPSEVLFAADRPRLRSRLFPGYFRPLPKVTQEAVAVRATAQSGSALDGEGLFLYCFSRVKQDQSAATRLSAFLTLYGFSRNVSFAALVSAALLAVGALRGTAGTGRFVSPAWWILIALISAIALLYRYLKFYRTYSREVFVSFVGLP